MRALIALILTWLALPAAEPLFERDNLAAWCIVPFDAKKRGPEERAAMLERLGFKHVGTMPQVGFKFGRWLDLALYQLLLETPRQPVDG